MKLQETKFSCGAASLRAALYVLGKCPWEKSIRKHAGTTPEHGTDEDGLRKAIEYYKFRHRRFQTISVREATDNLKKSLRRGYPVIICVDKESHWCAAVGMLGKKIMLFDPANSAKKQKYSGIRLYNVDDLAGRWGNVLPDGATEYYGIVVMPPKE